MKCVRYGRRKCAENCLLIVPVGIEIIERGGRYEYWCKLLIVPVGIEIRKNKSLNTYKDTLLIVPVGIEIRRQFSQIFILPSTFNRTSRNWNVLTGCWRPLNKSFNRTSRNWNRYQFWLWNRRTCTLIVPVGIEIAQVEQSRWADHTLLIVTVGIDISTFALNGAAHCLLIVPVGIEIRPPIPIKKSWKHF